MVGRSDAITGEWCNWQHDSLWSCSSRSESGLPSLLDSGGNACKLRLSVRSACEHMFACHGARHSLKSDAQVAIAGSICWADALRALGYHVKGANYRTLQKWARRWGISTDHFDPHIGGKRAGKAQQIPLSDVLVEGSTYNRSNLKTRSAGERPAGALLRDVRAGRDLARAAHGADPGSHQWGLKRQPDREPSDRVPELRRHAGYALRPETCLASEFAPGAANRSCLATFAHRHCSREMLGVVAVGGSARRAAAGETQGERPSYEQLMADVEAMSLVAVGRKYGVSDNAVRKWIRWLRVRSERNANSVEGRPEERP